MTIVYIYHTEIDLESILMGRVQAEDIPQLELTMPEDRALVSVGEMKVSFIDVGQGDATLIRTENHVILIDTASRSARQEILYVLHAKEIETIDLLILTHGHEDHIGNADTIFHYFEVLEVKYPKAGYELIETLVWQRVLEAINYHNINVTYPKPGQNRYFDDIRIDILGPLYGLRGINNNSIILRITHGNKSLMFFGDAEAEAERALVNTTTLTKADIILTPHHGSNTSTTTELLDVINPTYAIISVGANNRHNHPHNLVLNRLKERNIEVFRTDEQGTIKAISNGNYIRFEFQN